MKPKQEQPGFWWLVRLPNVNQSVSGKLFALGCTGIVEESPGLSAYFEATRFRHAGEAELAIHSALGASVLVTVEKIIAQDWGSEWKKYFKPVKIGQRFVIRPSWEKYRRQKNEIVLVIDPKMSFGTGTHESTRLVLQLMETYIRPKTAVLDAGTGTGILAIAAAKLKAAKIFGFDIDEHSYDNATENIRRNRCADKIKVVQGTLETLPARWPKRFDVILANIQRSVITEILEALLRRLKPKGLLITSGILTSETETMLEMFKTHGLSVVETRTDGEWVAFVLTR